MPIYKFPENFKWGSATSAHQIEGDNHNDWSEWEKSPKRIAEIKAKGLNPEDFISGKACDSHNRYKEDFDIAKKLNQNIHRFSIEWSRIEPEEGRFDEKEMQHYINVVKALRDRGIEPMITLWHFTNPVWFAKKGGFINLDSPKYFTRYVKYVVDHLKDQVGLWITFNEADDIYAAMSYYRGIWPPQERSAVKAITVMINIIRSHIRAYKEIRNIYSPTSLNKEVQPWISKKVEPRNPTSMSHNVRGGVWVGIVENNRHLVGGGMIGEIQQKIYEYFRNRFLLKQVLPYIDFIGLNYYTIDRMLGSFRNLPKQDKMGEMDWEIYPPGIYHELIKLKDFKKPVFITENGIADSDDPKRERFIKDHLYWVWKAIQDGINVRGYLYWSLLDSFEWHLGFKHWGLTEIDLKTFERHIRPSAWEYAKICKMNQLEIDS
ncbi:MAG: family 1 glycosylhydrolase [Candidatus Taylorbacteria bacterium]|nr:family 1 glycosylhydrolase [Candidatus Taylorbacteria bacterium]